MEDIKTKITEGASISSIANEYPAQFIRYANGIRQLHELLSPSKDEKTVYRRDSWSHPFVSLDEGPVIFCGPTGIGKTEFALAHFENPLLVRHVDDLKRLNGHDGIIFDDMSFLQWPDTSQIHLCDWTRGSSINCRYANAYIPAKVPRIFTTNDPEGRCLNLDNPAIARRVRVILMTDMLYKQTPDVVYETQDLE